jgi:hypothetical protein
VKERVGEHFRKQSSVKQRDIAFTDDWLLVNIVYFHIVYFHF